MNFHIRSIPGRRERACSEVNSVDRELAGEDSLCLPSFSARRFPPFFPIVFSVSTLPWSSDTNQPSAIAEGHRGRLRRGSAAGRENDFFLSLFPQTLFLNCTIALVHKTGFSEATSSCVSSLCVRACGRYARLARPREPRNLFVEIFELRWRSPCRIPYSSSVPISSLNFAFSSGFARFPVLANEQVTWFTRNSFKRTIFEANSRSSLQIWGYGLWFWFPVLLLCSVQSQLVFLNFNKNRFQFFAVLYISGEGIR